MNKMERLILTASEFKGYAGARSGVYVPPADQNSHVSHLRVRLIAVIASSIHSLTTFKHRPDDIYKHTHTHTHTHTQTHALEGLVIDRQPSYVTWKPPDLP